MNLRLVREPSRDGGTLGSLYVDGRWQCFTLEDVIRESGPRPISASGEAHDMTALAAWVKGWKLPAQTAIPAGAYRVAITPSARFLRNLPLLMNVPGFSGIRIHPGNGPLETEGCILVGRDRQAGRVLQSRAAFEDVFALLTTAAGEAWITIENPPSVRTMVA